MKITRKPNMPPATLKFSQLENRECYTCEQAQGDLFFCCFVRVGCGRSEVTYKRVVSLVSGEVYGSEMGNISNWDFHLVNAELTV